MKNQTEETELGGIIQGIYNTGDHSFFFLPVKFTKTRNRNFDYLFYKLDTFLDLLFLTS